MGDIENDVVGGAETEDIGTKDQNNVVVKIGLVGDAQVGKTTLMVKYVENKFDEDYIQTLGRYFQLSDNPEIVFVKIKSNLSFLFSLGVNFMEKTVSLRNTEITFSIWDLGGQKEFLSMLPLVCNDAVAIFFMFDLSRKSTLLSIKEWYRQARGLNRVSAVVIHFILYPAYW